MDLLGQVFEVEPRLLQERNPPVFRTDVLRIFGEEYDWDSDSDYDNDLVLHGPTVEYLEERWPPVAVDAVCVHIRGEKEVNISFPVAADLPVPAWGRERGTAETGDAADPNWLVGHISKTAWELFQQSARGAALVGAGAQIVGSVRRHKKELATLGEDTFCLKQARSDRPAFCIDVLERDARGDGAGDVDQGG